MTDEQAVELGDKLELFKCSRGLVRRCDCILEEMERGNVLDWCDAVLLLAQNQRVEERHLKLLADAVKPVIEQIRLDARRTMEGIEVTP